MKFAMKTLTALGLVGATTVAIAATVVSQTEPFPQIEDGQKVVAQVQANQMPTAPQQVASVNQAAISPAVNAPMSGQAVNQNAIAPVLTNVKQALGLRDDSRVQLKGYIVKSLGDEKYQFRDSSGSMTVDIDDELWNGQAISATTLVTLDGEVDIDYKPMKRVEIDVDYVSF